MDIDKRSRYLRIILLLYCLLMIYLMFFAFGRGNRWEVYMFSLKIDTIPLWFPKLNGYWLLWFFSLGNVLLFVPFGFLLPACFPRAFSGYAKSLLWFLVGITCVELAQMLSLLGIFDLEDILVNSLGFSIGYLVWRFWQRQTNLLSKILWSICIVLALTLLCIAVAEIFNYFFI